MSEPIERENPQHGGEKRRSSENGARRPTSKAELKRHRQTTAPGPTGFVYTVRAPLLERHALAGGFPARLRKLAMAGQEGLAEVFATEDEDEFREQSEGMIEYFDELVRTTIVEPEFTLEEIIGGLIPPPDYRWALGIAMGEVVHDGEGNSLWPQGRPLHDRFQEALTK
jgi:hypothetical protein